jgi:hypothetical protein
LAAKLAEAKGGKSGVGLGCTSATALEEEMEQGWAVKLATELADRLEEGLALGLGLGLACRLATA